VCVCPLVWVCMGVYVYSCVCACVRDIVYVLACVHICVYTTVVSGHYHSKKNHKSKNVDRVLVTSAHTHEYNARWLRVNAQSR
jgi:hypothetical protein